MGGLRRTGRGADGESLTALPVHAIEELTHLEKQLGGRRALVTALTFAPLNKDGRYILGLLGDPEYRDTSLAEICRMGRLLPGQLIDHLAKGTQLRARLLAQHAISNGQLAVVAEVMKRGATYEDDCTSCNGTGSATPDPTPEVPNPKPVACAVCLGHGKLRFDADPDCRDKALEMAGLIGKGGGGISIVNQQLNVQPGSQGNGSYERMQEALDEVLYGQVVEAETVPDPVPGEPDGPDPA
jgi:hypothetical protein